MFISYFEEQGVRRVLCLHLNLRDRGDRGTEIGTYLISTYTISDRARQRRSSWHDI